MTATIGRMAQEPSLRLERFLTQSTRWLGLLSRLTLVDSSVYCGITCSTSSEGSKWPGSSSARSTHAQRSSRRLSDRPQAMGGKWNTGVLEHDDEFFIFANVGIAGSTGHDYDNRWEGEPPPMVPPAAISPPPADGCRDCWSQDAAFMSSGGTLRKGPSSTPAKPRPRSQEDTTPVEILWSFSNPTPPESSYLPSHAHQDLFLPPTHFDRLLTSLKFRKNLILQGPPGTGKTFIARRIAWCLIGHEDNGPIEMVQFHQSYAYEDFVQGFRPTDTERELRPSSLASSTAFANARAPTRRSLTSSLSTRSTAATCRASSANFSC